MNYGNVTFQAHLATYDSADPGTEPDHVPITGYVDFVPSRTVTYSSPSGVLVLGKITAGIDEDGILRDGNGNAFVTLIAADSPELSHQEWSWIAYFRLNGVEVGPYPFVLHDDDVIDLFEFAPVEVTNGVAIIRGPAGDPGPAGPTGPQGPPGINGSGAVNSVNGQTGTVLLTASHVGAQPAGTYTTPTTLTAALVPYSKTADLAPVAFSGDFNDLTSTPTFLSPSDLPEQVQDLVAGMIVAGSNVSLSYNDATGLLTISSSGGNGTVVDATPTVKGIIQLAGDMSGTAAAPTVPGKVNRIFFKKTITANYTLVAVDAIDSVLHSTAASAITITLPQDSAVVIAQEVGMPWRQYGAGQITFAAGAGATVLSRGGALKSAGQYAEGLVTKVAANTYVVSGDLVV